MSKEKSCIFGETPSVENNREPLIRRRIEENYKTKGRHNQTRKGPFRNKTDLRPNKLVKKGDLEK